ncbi:alpha/beta hydrolase [Paenarthrobacter sp. DKR-5]|uniref:alpha/beta fold hydrolase n=1 Tax=Paenarthrobacter sp. DKR-5 TaxID=2835535 RepID=UPI001BDCD9AE|nr:alpha/beta fold hydrolase [Paenarthrobacter sp. DKR-5]MBT1001195.1 alpha/beta hydrolase [Paenarthrobacter sp. DKR-5]
MASGFSNFPVDLPGLAKRDVFVTKAGDGGEVYVLVHGIGVSSRYFLPLARELALKNTVYVVEMPGFGRTDEPHRPLAMADFARVLWAALDAAGLDQAVLVGHSMGSQVVTEMALQRPAATRRLVLLGPTVDDARRTVRAQAGRLLLDTLREPAGVNRVVLSDYLRCGPRWYVKTLRKMMEHRLEERIGLVEAPVLIAAGTADPIAPRPWLERLAALAREAEVRQVDGAAHVLMYRDPEAVAGMLRTVAP